jgi:hypothetical protein
MRTAAILFRLGIVVLSIASIVWVANFIESINKYDEYCETGINQGGQLPKPYYAWSWGKKLNLTFIALFFLWIPFVEHFLRKITYPFLKKKLTCHNAKKCSRSASRTSYEKIYGFVLGYFIRVNRRVNVKIPIWFMKLETFEHVHYLTKVFKWIVLPLSVLYGFAMYLFFGLNALDALLLANLIFFYSNFVPDLPAIFRKKVYHDVRDTRHEDLPWYKRYTLLLLAPFFIAILFCGIKIQWKTTETFHNFKSIAVYGFFLFLLCCLILVVFQFSFSSIIEFLCVPVYAILGYLTHLKVDLVF